MLGPAWFTLAGVEIQPFAIAPWAEDSGPEYERLPNLLKRLRGEWVCVPFGIERADEKLPEEWRPTVHSAAQVDLWPHGWSSNAQWRLEKLAGSRIALSLEYPEAHPVKRLRRTITASAIQPVLHFGLAIEVRAPCALPIGLHPIFRLPIEPRRAVLELDGASEAWTPPVSLQPDIAHFRRDLRNVPLDRIPLLNGSEEDVTRLPLPYAAEELVFVRGHCGCARLSNLDERYTVVLSWDPKVLPGCQLWLSNRGRTAYPWNGRFLAVGIEPVRAAFDLGTRVSQHSGNPLQSSGTSCTVALHPARAFEIAYCIAVG